MASKFDPKSVMAPRIPFQPEKIPATRASVQRLRPGEDITLIDPLAQIWDEVVHNIVGAMLEPEMEDQSPLHINLREDMILELAKLQLWLGDRVVEMRLGDRELAAIDPETEHRECLGPGGVEPIAETAKLAHQHIWARMVKERWKPKSTKAIERDKIPRRPKPAIKRVDKNHFIPRWIIRDMWSSEGKILRWRRSATGWCGHRRGFGTWGFRRNLYSDRLEAYLGLIEGDAKRPIEMLLDTRPLNGPQRHSFIGFLVLQILRSPFFRDATREELFELLAKHGYKENPDMERAAYEDVFRDNNLYGQLAGPLMDSRWALVRAPAPMFVLPDTFGARTNLGDQLKVIIPLNPTICFVTLPAKDADRSIVPSRLSANEGLARKMSAILIGSAAHEFLSHRDFQIEESATVHSLVNVLSEIESEIDAKSDAS